LFNTKLVVKIVYLLFVVLVVFMRKRRRVKRVEVDCVDLWVVAVVVHGVVAMFLCKLFY
jgi:hypothetical protein